MVLLQSEYDAAYFGDTVESTGLRHEAGYSDYLFYETNWIQKKRIESLLRRYTVPKNAKIVELGAGVGFMGLVAQRLGYTDWTCLDWSNWCKRHEVYPVTEEDALVFLASIPDNSLDYIISRAFLECFTDTDIDRLVNFFTTKARKQIHTTFKTGRSAYYTIKTMTDWRTKIRSSSDIIVEEYRQDG